jgi:hypothetical protein
MKFNEQHLVIINTLSKDEGTAFIKFLQSEIIRHLDDIQNAEELINTVKKEILDAN